MRVLITGASGFVGRKLLTSFKAHGDEVLGTYNNTFYPDLRHLDVTNSNETRQLFREFKPEVVIHAGSMGRPDECEQNPQSAFKINVEGTRNVVEASRETNSFLIFPSSIYVFDGRKQGSYNESDAPNPISVYGETKKEAERLVQELRDSIIIRTDMIYGYNGEGFKNGFVDILNLQKTIQLDDENVRHPFFVDDLEAALRTLLNHEKRGIFHLAGNKRITQFDLGKKLEAILGSHATIEKKTVPLVAPRPKNLAIDISKANSEGIVFTDFETSLHVIAEQEGRGQNVEGSQTGLLGKEKYRPL